jgi:DNA-binding CsgD family transcriptional regulator
MKTALQSLFQAIAQANDEQELRSSVIAQIGAYFAANRWGLFFFAALPTITQNAPSNILQLALSLDHNPVLRYLVEHHAPVHEEVVLPAGMWQKICPRADHAHVMAGPIVSNGQLVGGIGFTRDREAGTFSSQNLADLSALCLHLSTRLAALRAQPTPLHSLSADRLTPREMQIVELVAQGLTNIEIGAALWITENSVKQALKRMFRKLGVTSRTELVTRLSLPQGKAASL